MARRSFVRSARRATQWTSTVPETAFIILAAGSSVIDSTFVTTSGAPETLIRVRGLFTVQTDQTAAAEAPFGAIGIAVVSDEAAAAGAASVPLPYTDAESDLWVMHQFFAAPFEFGTAVGFSDVARQYEIDSKAMRKVSEDQTLVLMVQNGSAAHGMQYRLDLRLLAKVA